MQLMARHIWAALMYRVSTNETPQHQFFQEGKDSWCGWQRHAAGFEEPNSRHDSIPPAVFKVVKPVWARLSAKDLLQKCTRQATQNTNESFNGMQHGTCAPDKGMQQGKVETAVTLSIMR